MSISKTVERFGMPFAIRETEPKRQKEKDMRSKLWERLLVALDRIDREDWYKQSTIALRWCKWAALNDK